MGRVGKSREAEQDINDILLTIAVESSVETALRWLTKFDDFLQRIARTPGSGTSRESFRKGLRSVPFGNYLVFFRRTRGGVEIVRVVHGARRWRRLLKDI